MRKVVLYMMVTYDGRLADENNGLDWTVNPGMDGDLPASDRWEAAIIGAGGYREMAAYWPTATDDPDISADDKAFAGTMNAMKKYVFATEEHELGWHNSELVRVSDDASIVDAIGKLKQQSGGDLVVYGGVRIAQTLARLDLIDEYITVVHPVVIGTGRPLFEQGTQRLALELVGVKHNDDGAVQLHYRRR